MTHDVFNQPPELKDYNLFERDLPLQEALKREGKKSADKRLRDFGAVLGQEHTLEQGRLANEHPPELKLFDRFGHRRDEVEFHPAYHHMMALGIGAEVPSVAWNGAKDGGHVTHLALKYMLYQVEGGVCCPMTMTYAAVPALQHNAELAKEWLPRLLSPKYDQRFLPAKEKNGATIGMAMTEKQGGSDVRANTTKALPLGNKNYELVGHKWFCSAPMCDAFLTLAYTEVGLSCFLVPRWTPDGEKNHIFIQRLKDKLGNKSNASSEIEYHNAFATLVGEEGRGVATIIDMVHHTRLDCSVAAPSLMRQAFVQAVHHAHHRSAFQKKLIDQPLMQSVLADLALEIEAAVALSFHVARKFDQGETVYSRLAVAVAKYWHNKRVPGFVYECMECLGGAGYVEEGIMPRLYREAPLNSIWEGSGNVICLDILRTLHKTPEALDLYFAEIAPALDANTYLDQAVKDLKNKIAKPQDGEREARLIVERLALCLQGALLVQHAPDMVADAFCESRLGGNWGLAYGTLPVKADARKIIARAWKD